MHLSLFLSPDSAGRFHLFSSFNILFSRVHSSVKIKKRERALDEPIITNTNGVEKREQQTDLHRGRGTELNRD